MGKSSIEWTDETWNPTRGCSIVSPGCHQCYAMKQGHRFSGPGKAYEGLTELTPKGVFWTGKVRIVPEMLAAPAEWKRPRKVFVDSMSDLFHDDVPFGFIAAVFGVMQSNAQHQYQVLTKRSARMWDVVSRLTVEDVREYTMKYTGRMIGGDWSFPMNHVRLGVSTENQAMADKRIPEAIVPLLDAGWKMMISVEPMLGPISFKKVPGFNRYNTPLHRLWVIVGGESGRGNARPLNVAWARSIIEQCQVARVPVFMKQMGSNAQTRNDQVADVWFYADGSDMETEAIDADSYRVQGELVRLMLKSSKGGDPAEWPEYLRVREWPA